MLSDMGALDGQRAWRQPRSLIGEALHEQVDAHAVETAWAAP